MGEQVKDRIRDKLHGLGADIDNPFVRSEYFDRIVRDLVKGQSLSPVDLNEIVTMVADQQGRWECEYLFSPSVNPDVNARKEAVEYERIWRVLAESLVNVSPEIKESTYKIRDLLELKYSLDRRVKQTAHNPIALFTNLAIHKFARALFLLGFTSAGNKLEAIALYPRGSVGRTM